MPEQQLPLVLSQRHANHQLFADRYLDVTRPNRTAPPRMPVGRGA